MQSILFDGWNTKGDTEAQDVGFNTRTPELKSWLDTLFLASGGDSE